MVMAEKSGKGGQSLRLCGPGEMGVCIWVCPLLDHPALPSPSLPRPPSLQCDYPQPL